MPSCSIASIVAIGHQLRLFKLVSVVSFVRFKVSLLHLLLGSVALSTRVIGYADKQKAIGNRQCTSAGSFRGHKAAKGLCKKHVTVVYRYRSPISVLFRSMDHGLLATGIC